MQPESAYWFRAKRYGWGWGAPLRWQGWAVVVAFFVLLGLGHVLLWPTGHSPALYLVYAGLLISALFGVCYAKGEPLKWRWGR